mmetsp:Transcript_28585/g.28968  ORF Transcript_28585/g.28968 Transcript_28585/m.28968 type:complete len:97 (-) Transcript_28585:43-333(-)
MSERRLLFFSLMSSPNQNYYIVPALKKPSRNVVALECGCMFVASAGRPLLGLPFVIFMYKREGEYVTTCVPPPGGTDPGLRDEGDDDHTDETILRE